MTLWTKIVIIATMVKAKHLKLLRTLREQPLRIAIATKDCKPDNSITSKMTGYTRTFEAKCNPASNP